MLAEVIKDFNLKNPVNDAFRACVLMQPCIFALRVPAGIFESVTANRTAAPLLPGAMISDL